MGRNCGEPDNPENLLWSSGLLVVFILSLVSLEKHAPGDSGSQILQNQAGNQYPRGPWDIQTPRVCKLLSCTQTYIWHGLAALRI